MRITETEMVAKHQAKIKEFEEQKEQEQDHEAIYDWLKPSKNTIGHDLSEETNSLSLNV